MYGMFHRYFIYFFYIFIASFQVQISTQSPINFQHPFSYGRNYPQRTIAGVSVIDTPIVRAAAHYAHQHSSDFVYKHVIRSWLFGAIIINNNDTLRGSVDLEVHAVAALLHDLGWDQTPGSPFISRDRRFEVDSAIHTREFIKNFDHGRYWDKERLQLTWDSVAFHSQPDFHEYKELEVKTTGEGILSEFSGPRLGITDKDFAKILAEFPNDDMRDGFNETILWLCQSKPSTTYDTWLQPWGDNYVTNYKSKGNRFFDAAFAFLP